jgi:hypothetical protein
MRLPTLSSGVTLTSSATMMPYQGGIQPSNGCGQVCGAGHPACPQGCICSAGKCVPIRLAFEFVSIVGYERFDY